MSIYFAFVVLTLTVVGQERVSEIATRIKPSVVTIIAVGKDKGKTSFGTGFFVVPDFDSVIKPKESTAAFAKRIRRAFDAYHDKKDVDLVSKVLNIYPEYRKTVAFSGTIEDIAPEIVVKIAKPRPGSFVITNWHVIEGADSIGLKTHNGQMFTVTDIVAVSEESDIVLLRTDSPLNKFPTLQLATEYPEQGDDVLVLGTSLGVFEGSLTKGIVSATRKMPSIGEVLQITAPLSEGNSGSPVLNMEGKVVGVATFKSAKGENLNFAISQRILERLLFPDDPARLYR